MRTATVAKDSALLRLAVELYVRHRPDAGGWCPRCERLDCPVRSHAGEVVQAAGHNPALLDTPPRRPEATPWANEPTTELPVYGVGGLPWPTEDATTCSTVDR